MSVMWIGYKWEGRLLRNSLVLLKKLEEFIILEVPPQMLFEIADVTAALAKMVVKVHCMEKVLSKIANKKEHLSLLQEKEFMKEARTTGLRERRNYQSLGRD